MYPIAFAFFVLGVFFEVGPHAQGNSAGAAHSAQIDPSVVERANNYLKAILAGDAAAVAAIYREDAGLMPNECPLLQGRAAIEHYYREWFKSPAKVTVFTFTHLESSAVDDTAYDVGTYRQTLSLPAGGTVNDSGKYSVILKRSGGEWKIAYLIFNSDSPSKMPPKASGAR
jgi:uncharacterized protein (TIGR02246 family)